MTDHALNPAEQAAAVADAEVENCIRHNRSFRLEAGAGAGKTHSLISALRFLIRERGAAFAKARQRIACITYTNVAKNEIDTRTDSNPLIYSGTIHSFCWALIQDFQPRLREIVPTLAKWEERIAEHGSIGQRKIVYNLGHPKIEERQVLLGHDDVIALTVQFLPLPKFRRLMVERFPVLFIDEYQDTDRNFAEALRTHVLGGQDGLLLGLFGDAWQKIYGSGCGAIQHDALHFIGKGANFRSAPRIVEALNRIRPELPQNPRDPHGGGFVGVYHTNDWPGARRTGQHWGGDLQPDAARQALEQMRHRLAGEGWSFTGDKTKILALTHKVLAAEQGYKELADAFAYNDSFVKKEDAFIAYFADKLEPACVAYSKKRYGEMFAILEADDSLIATPADKAAWTQEMNALLALRLNGTVAAVLDHLKAAQRIPFPDALRQIDQELDRDWPAASADEPSACTRLRNMRPVVYQQVINLVAFIEGHTPFQTKHGVKGAQFENVLVIFGRGWNHYNFEQFLAWNGQPPPDQTDFYERNRNLFYVVCSRPQQRLALLFTQRLNTHALATLGAWFGVGAIHSLPPPNQN